MIRQSHTGAAAPPPGQTIRVLCRRSSVDQSRLASVNSACATASASQPSRTASRKANARARRSSPAIPRRTTGRRRRAGPAHHLHVVALGTADHVQQTRVAALADPHAYRVVTTVQCAHHRLQRLSGLSGGQRIPVGAHHDAFTATAAYPIPAVTVAADRALPDRAVVGARPAHHQRLEPRQFLGVHPRIDEQP